MKGVRHRVVFVARDYDLAATLESGQAFRWVEREGQWEGVVGRWWVALRQAAGGDIEAGVMADPGDWGWLRAYLRVEEELAPILASFPADAPMRAAVASCRGLRLLRQEPWECLASFLLSSTKQIPQIRQGVRLLCERFGEPIDGRAGGGRVHAFPTVDAVAGASEAALRECRIGFRARYLKATAEAVAGAGGEGMLEGIRALPLAEARGRLVAFPGVGPKIADCVLLFAYGFRQAFPVDVWVMRALRELYFPGGRPLPSRLRQFSDTHFGPHAGYAQQYLFHHVRKQAGRIGKRRNAEMESCHGD